MALSSTTRAAVLAGLSAEDPRAGLQAALDALARVGLSTTAPAADQAPWLTWRADAHGKPLHLFRKHDAVVGDDDEDARELVREAIAALRLRVHEREQLRMIRERLDLLSHASFEGLFFHVDGRILFANERVAEMLGSTVEDFYAPGAIQRVIAPEDIGRVMQRIASGDEGSYVITCVREDGSRFLAELQAKQGKLGERPVRVVAVRDVTEREHHANRLRESEARLRGLAESTFDMLAVTREGMVIDVGGRNVRMLGREPEEMIGRPIFDFVAPSAHAVTRDVITQQRTTPFESLLVAKDGELVPVEVVGGNATFQGQPVRFAGIRDLRDAKRAEAERHRLQARTERGQRLEALGVLAGGIAHDFNNLLVGINGNAELLGLQELDEDQRQLVDAIVSAGQRASNLTRQLLAYAGRRSVPGTEPVDVGALLEELRTALSGTLAPQADLRLHLTPGCVVAGDHATLSQVLMNLLTNASDALEGKPGRIDVHVRRSTVPDARWDDALGARVGPGSWVEVTVRDDGMGMEPSTRARIFEPFFTTKTAGHGLGLAGCLGILEAHRGAVLVESAPGEGSVFSLLLPAAQTTATSESPPSDVAGLEPCKVLIVDDDAVVRRQLARMLALRGFEVEEAESGGMALARLPEVNPELVVMDYEMTDINGLECAQRMRDRGYDAPILMMSAYYAPGAEGLLATGVIQAFLAKPYDLRSLSRAIARARG